MEGKKGHSTHPSSARGTIHASVDVWSDFFCGFLFWILSLFCAVVDAETALYNELWHACAGPLVTVPREGDHVFYFPQGHLEQVWFCFVLAVSFLPFSLRFFSYN
jgi:hypothetical protein